MRTILTLIIVSISYFQIQAQNFEAQLYFEDSLGERDTLTFGRAETATNNFFGEFDEEFGEVDIKIDSLDDFDVRFYLVRGDNPNMEFELFWFCDAELNDNSRDLDETFYELKNIFIPPSECSENSFGFRQEFFIPVDAAYPITISWDRSLFQDSCNFNANISEVPFAEQDGLEIFGGEFCPENINYPFISLNDLDQFVLEEPNFLSYERLREDTVLVSTYYLTVPNRLDGDIMNNTSSLKEFSQNMYPNPVQDKLYVETTDQIWNYQILNIQGQEMMEGEYQNFIGVEALPSGIYFLQLQQEGDLYKAIKFVKE